ncbi:HlyD family type I secretion periplasmic adaptor subunit [Geminicoccus flavidas]|uniref:HlyD family type I secretion periplasmic adaptor subunit n=1 Tax=Geminicoccus flavidas TaxID=2506407 RepID=UPI001356C374|nr:HlyD family type I secretion periplasmic adaptor subunit [Geminicoccus flavidas]
MSTDIHAQAHRRASLKAPLLAGAVIGLAFFACFGGWAATAPLAGAVAAPAVVVPEGDRKQVQHLEGGIVREILIRDGSRVRAREPLVRLDDTDARAAHTALLARWHALRATEARLEAERAGAAAPDYPADLLAEADGDGTLARILQSEAERLASRQAALADQQAVLREQVAQAEAQISGHESLIASAERQLALIREEGAGARELFAKGLERKPRLLALQRVEAQIEGAIASSRTEIAQAARLAGEARQKMRSLTSSHAEQVAAELAETRKALAPVLQELRSTADRLARTVVTAPVTGTVVDLRPKTVGGVVVAGEPLLDIVPDDAELLLEAHVSPVDVDEVHTGLQAQIHLLAYHGRNLPRINGTIREVSPDRLQDPATLEPYYLARVAVDSTLPDGVHMAPGMPAEVMILTSERTLLSYLMQPVTETLRRGLRES